MNNTKKPFRFRGRHFFIIIGIMAISHIGLHIGHVIALLQTYDIALGLAVGLFQYNLFGRPFEPFTTIFSNGIVILSALLANILAVMLVFLSKEKRKNFHRRKTEHGSAKFAKVEDFAHLKNPATSQNIIISKDIMLSIEHHSTGVNLNIIIIGGPGSGKTRFFMKPNILNLANKEKGPKQTNLIITDPKGSLLKATGEYLKKQGYKIKLLDLFNIKNSDFYNPFSYMRLDHADDVIMLIDTLIKSTENEEEQRGGGSNDAFWKNAEKMLLQALFFYILEVEPAERQNIVTLLELLDENLISQNQENPLQARFDDLEKSNPKSLSVSFWKKIGAGNIETMRTVVTIANARFSLFASIKHMFSKDTFELNAIDERPTAIFVSISPANSSLNFIATLFYTQLFQQIDYIAKQRATEMGLIEASLNRTTLFLLDEFANIPKIPNFLKMLAYARSLNIGVVPIFQSPVQAKEMYKDSWETIVDSCDTTLYLGGNQSNFSTKYISEMLGKETIDMQTRNISYNRGKAISTNASVLARDLMTPDEIGRMKKSDSIIKFSFSTPLVAQKYNLENHSRYAELADATKKAGKPLTPNNQAYKHNVPEWNVIDVYYEEITITEDLVREWLEEENEWTAGFVQDQAQAAQNAEDDANGAVKAFVSASAEDEYNQYNLN